MEAITVFDKKVTTCRFSSWLSYACVAVLLARVRLVPGVRVVDDRLSNTFTVAVAMIALRAAALIEYNGGKNRKDR